MISDKCFASFTLNNYVIVFSARESAPRSRKLVGCRATTGVERQYPALGREVNNHATSWDHPACGGRIEFPPTAIEKCQDLTAQQYKFLQK